VIVPGLRAAIDLPTPEDIECLAIHDEYAGRSIGAVLAAAAERADVDAFRPAVNCVRARVAGLFEYLLGFDDFMNLRLGRIRFRIDDINAGGTHPGEDEIAAFEESVPCERRQSRRAGVPAEMVKLVALIGHHHRMDDLTEGRRAGLYIDNCKRVRF